MKVLFLLPASYPEGPASAKLIQRLAFGLEASGVACEVLCFDKSLSGAREWRRDSCGVAYFGVKLSRKKVGRLLQGVSLARQFRSRVRDAVAQRGVTHVWVYNPSWFLWRHVVRSCRASQTVVIAHLVEWWQFQVHLGQIYFDQQMFLRFCRPYLDGIVGISSLWVKFAQEHKVPAIRVPVPCPVTAQTALYPLQTSPRKSGAFTLIYSGQLYRRDMPEVMLGAIRTVMMQDRSINMVVLGKTDAWPESRAFCKAVAGDPQLRNRVTITGYLSECAYAQHLERADAFLLLHADSWESRACFPTRLPEYLSTGKPVIVSGVGDIPQYLRNEIDALVLSPGNTVEELASAILRLAHDPELSARLGAAGRVRALEHFSPVKLGQRLQKFLDGLEIAKG
jgi:glycosyltransferase involved in cell wall biosynthesis